jgi:hypothetical protein
MAGKPSWEQANRRQKLGLVWRIRKKISQIIKDYFYLPFFLLIILWFHISLWRRAVSTNDTPCWFLKLINAAVVVMIVSETRVFSFGERCFRASKSDESFNYCLFYCSWRWQRGCNWVRMIFSQSIDVMLY